MKKALQIICAPIFKAYYDISQKSRTFITDLFIKKLSVLLDLVCPQMEVTRLSLKYFNLKKSWNLGFQEHMR